jgi:hypothetical protein
MCQAIAAAIGGMMVPGADEDDAGIAGGAAEVTDMSEPTSATAFETPERAGRPIRTKTYGKKREHG